MHNQVGAIGVARAGFVGSAFHILAHFEEPATSSRRCGSCGRKGADDPARQAAFTRPTGTRNIGAAISGRRRPTLERKLATTWRQTTQRMKQKA